MKRNTKFGTIKDLHVAKKLEQIEKDAQAETDKWMRRIAWGLAVFILGFVAFVWWWGPAA